LFDELLVDDGLASGASPQSIEDVVAVRDPVLEEVAAGFAPFAKELEPGRRRSGRGSRREPIGQLGDDAEAADALFRFEGAAERARSFAHPDHSGTATAAAAVLAVDGRVLDREPQPIAVVGDRDVGGRAGCMAAAVGE
jgi:hypothetical protein